MSDEEIDRAVKEAAEYEAQDKKRKEAVDAKNEADSFAVQTENALKEVGDKLDPADKSAVEADLQALKDLVAKYEKPEEMTEDQVGELKAAREKLTESAQKVFTKMYENMQQAGAQGAGPDMSQFTEGMGGAGQAGPGPDAGSDDGVVDADFKEV